MINKNLILVIMTVGMLFFIGVSVSVNEEYQKVLIENESFRTESYDLAFYSCIYGSARTHNEYTQVGAPEGLFSPEHPNKICSELISILKTQAEDSQNE